MSKSTIIRDAIAIGHFKSKDEAIEFYKKKLRVSPYSTELQLLLMQWIFVEMIRLGMIT